MDSFGDTFLKIVGLLTCFGCLGLVFVATAIQAHRYLKLLRIKAVNDIREAKKPTTDRFARELKVGI